MTNEEPALADYNQMNALLTINENRFSVFLQSVYFNRKCNYFYYGLLAASVLLGLIIVVDGFKVAESPAFIFVELLLNACITLDFVLKVRLSGLRKFFKSNAGHYRWWNWFDTFVVLTCNILFVMLLTVSKGPLKHLDESMADLMLVVWSVWQLLRLVLIAKKQRLAKQNARTLINFENIVVDTDFG